MVELKIERTKSTFYKIHFVRRKLSGISYDSKTYDFFILLSEKVLSRKHLTVGSFFANSDLI